MWRGVHRYLGSEDPHAGPRCGETVHVRPLWEDVFLQLSAAEAPAAGPRQQGQGRWSPRETETNRSETLQL